MIHVIEPHNSHMHTTILDGMYRLRAQIFFKKLGWQVDVRNGLEKDRFDEEGPIYIVHTDGAGSVDGGCRLLPTTGPTLIEEAFADTLPDVAGLSSPSIWECTRLCVDPRAGIAVSGALIAAIGTVALQAGVDSILGNFDRSMLVIYRRLGCEVTVLGSTTRFAKTVYLGSFPVSEEILARVNDRIESLMIRTIAA